jgi:ubiquinone/menaquinone biosynthesis C-methylase UbiE
MNLQLLAAQLCKPDGEYGKKIGEMMNKGNVHINLWAIDALKLQPNDTVLEIGMGNGFFAKDILAKHGSISYKGFDYSELMVNEALELNKESVEKQRAEFTAGSANKLPYADHSFSKILTVNTIYFWSNAKEELSEIRRVLKSDGSFVIAVRTKDAMKQLPFTEFGFVKYDKQQLETILKENGFDISETYQKKEPAITNNGQDMQMENIIIRCTISVPH